MASRYLGGVCAPLDSGETTLIMASSLLDQVQMSRQSSMNALDVLFLLLLLARDGTALYPFPSESRASQSLDGLWLFLNDSANVGFEQKWFQMSLLKVSDSDVLLMPVPSSYNDIPTSADLRDFLGWVWYERDFFVDPAWFSRRVVLRMASVNYYAMVYVNGIAVCTHEGGHLPFEAELPSSVLLWSSENRLTIAVNNTLTPSTIPPGTVEWFNDTLQYPPGYHVQNLQMDFFNYAGIQRSVTLYSTPMTYVQDVSLIANDKGNLTFNVTLGGPQRTSVPVGVEITDANGSIVARSKTAVGSLSVTGVNLWWPRGMGVTTPGYLYTFTVRAGDDIYRLQFGFRSVQVAPSSILINGKAFYCKGTDKHEDSDVSQGGGVCPQLHQPDHHDPQIRGRGFDLAVMSRDFALLKWLGANCVRTSHYPYAEEFYQTADREGFAVIGETPAVGLLQVDNFGPVSLRLHQQMVTEMISRDKNHPCVIAWSMANEPKTSLSQSKTYFQTVIATAKALDPTRPVTFVVGGTDFNNDVVAPFVDFLCINRYYAWYSQAGHLEVIAYQLKYDLTQWHQLYAKPVILSEYGADTIAGTRALPGIMFTEDFQLEFMKQYHMVLDELRSQFVTGELVWNFADFMTVQGTTRAFGNRKGMFTRQRQPKAAAYLLRSRYLAI